MKWTNGSGWVWLEWYPWMAIFPGLFSLSNLHHSFPLQFHFKRKQSIVKPPKFLLPHLLIYLFLCLFFFYLLSLLLLSIHCLCFSSKVSPFTYALYYSSCLQKVIALAITLSSSLSLTSLKLSPIYSPNNPQIISPKQSNFIQTTSHPLHCYHPDITELDCFNSLLSVSPSPFHLILF